MLSVLPVDIANVRKEGIMSNMCIRCGLEIPADEATEDQLCEKCKEIRKNGKARHSRKVDTRHV